MFLGRGKIPRNSGVVQRTMNELRLMITESFRDNENKFLLLSPNSYPTKFFKISINISWQIHLQVVLYASRLWPMNWKVVWRSRVAGRARTIGNRVYPKRVSRVQIPPSPPEKKSLCRKTKAFLFNEINPLQDLWNALRAWNMASPCEMPAGVGGFISFHFLRKQKISQWRSSLFHIRRIFH